MIQLSTPRPQARVQSEGMGEAEEDEEEEEDVCAVWHSVCLDRCNSFRRGCLDSLSWYACRARTSNKAVGLAAATGAGLLISRIDCTARIEATARHGVMIEKVIVNALLCVQVIV